MHKLVRLAATFWGVVVFMPVGVNYLAFFALLACMSIQGQRAERWRRVRSHLLFWPLAAYVAWTLVVLVFQPTFYAETPSNLWHGLRIVLTLALALALTEDEALWAVRGFMVATLFSLLVIVGYHLFGLPDWPLWRHLVVYRGNKAISNVLLMSLLAGSALVLVLARGGRARLLAILAALILFDVIIYALPNRTALLVVLLAFPLAAVHQWRHDKRKLAGLLAIALVASAVVVTGVPAIWTRLAQGADEVQLATEGDVSRASWNLRVQMARHTARMIVERPWMGWGIGGWNDQWRRRAPPLIADLNMPHNDFLWMGAQAGVPGALSWLAIMLAACWAGWRRQDLTGRFAFVAAMTLLLSALVNSATRDAVIGLSLLWVVGLYLRLGAGGDISLGSLFRPSRTSARASATETSDLPPPSTSTLSTACGSYSARPAPAAICPPPGRPAA